MEPFNQMLSASTDIRDKTMPLTAAMHDWIGAQQIASFDSVRDADGDLPPPWRVFPTYSPTSMGWRMGDGEAYMSYWQCFYVDLSTEDKRRYRRKHRRPLYWFWFYWDSESALICIVQILTALLTYPMRVILHWNYRLFGPERIKVPSFSNNGG